MASPYVIQTSLFVITFFSFLHKLLCRLKNRYRSSRTEGSLLFYLAVGKVPGDTEAQSSSKLMWKAPSSKHVGTQDEGRREWSCSASSHTRVEHWSTISSTLLHILWCTIWRRHGRAKIRACPLLRWSCRWDVHFVAHRHSYAIVDSRNTGFEVSSTQWGLLSFGIVFVFFPLFGLCCPSVRASCLQWRGELYCFPFVALYDVFGFWISSWCIPCQL